MVPRNSTPGGFACIWQSKWVGIIAIKTERTQIHFLSDVLVAVALFYLNVPNRRKTWDGKHPLPDKLKRSAHAWIEGQFMIFPSKCLFLTSYRTGQRLFQNFSFKSSARADITNLSETYYGPFSSCLEPLFQSEANCEAIVASFWKWGF